MTTLWQRCAAKIKEEVSPQTFARWFAGVEELGTSESSLAIQAPDPFTADTLRSRYWGIISDILKQEAGPNVALTISVGDGPTNGASTLYAPDEIVPVKKILALPEEPHTPSEKPAFLNPRYRFENFVVGGSNQFAHACSLRLADGKGVALNPLFIYGGVGSEKPTSCTLSPTMFSTDAREHASSTPPRRTSSTTSSLRSDRIRWLLLGADTEKWTF